MNLTQNFKRINYGIHGQIPNAVLSVYSVYSVVDMFLIFLVQARRESCALSAGSVCHAHGTLWCRARGARYAGVINASLLRMDV